MNKGFVSRAGEKLEFALNSFNVDLTEKVAADFGCSTGGFVDVLLRRGAKKVYAVDVAYGELNYTLRMDGRVVVLERTNAMYVDLPELMDFISIDVGWTKQEKIVPNALKNMKERGSLISLIKPFYELGRSGKLLTEEETKELIVKLIAYYKSLDGVSYEGLIDSPIKGERGKNKEFLVFLKKG
ncbi:MAG: SAM-dependent methyltransferase [Patescibacteria group bacterium]